MTDTIDLSLAIPCYNEASHLRESVVDLIAILDRARFRYEILFIDDCSTDNTREILEDICRQHKQCRCLFHETNKGRGGAFKTGFANTSGRVTGFIDIDLEVHARYIPGLVDLIDREGYDVATGYRHYKLSQTGAIHRVLLSMAYRFVCRWLLGLGVKDSETGCKFFKRETATDVVLGSKNDGWFWDTEVMSRASLADLKIAEMPVVFRRRMDKLSTVKLVSDVLAYIKALYSFRSDVGLGMLDRSPIFWTARGYDVCIRLLVGRQYKQVYQEVSGLIPEASSVTDVCGGTAVLYRKFLKRKKCTYRLLDGNGHFVMAARNQGIPAKLCNVLVDDIPEADYVILCSSMYQFHQHEDELFDKLQRAAKKSVIISEPVDNLSSHPCRPLGVLANFFTNPGRMSRTGQSDYGFRYDRESFREFAERNQATKILSTTEKRNAVAVFERRS